MSKKQNFTHFPTHRMPLSPALLAPHSLHLTNMALPINTKNTSVFFSSPPLTPSPSSNYVFWKSIVSSTSYLPSLSVFPSGLSPPTSYLLTSLRIGYKHMTSPLRSWTPFKPPSGTTSASTPHSLLSHHPKADTHRGELVAQASSTSAPLSTHTRSIQRSVIYLKGAFSHSAGTAPIITVIIQVTTLKTTHLRNHAQSIQNSNIQTSDACHGSQGPKFCPL